MIEEQIENENSINQSRNTPVYFLAQHVPVRHNFQPPIAIFGIAAAAFCTRAHFPRGWSHLFDLLQAQNCISKKKRVEKTRVFEVRDEFCNGKSIFAGLRGFICHPRYRAEHQILKKKQYVQKMEKLNPFFAQF